MAPKAYLNDAGLRQHRSVCTSKLSRAARVSLTVPPVEDRGEMYRVRTQGHRARGAPGR